MIASGFLPVGTSTIFFKVFRSKMAAVDVCPLLTKPFPSSGASAMPCTPSVFNFPDHRAGIDVEDFHLRAVRNVQPPRALVHDEIIPAALARHRNLFRDLIPLSPERRYKVANNTE